MSQSAGREASYVLTLEEIGSLAQEGGKPAETLMNVVALIARRFQTDVCRMVMDYALKCYVPAAGGTSSDMSRSA